MLITYFKAATKFAMLYIVYYGILRNVNSQSVLLATTNIEAQCFIIPPKLQVHSSFRDIHIKAPDKVCQTTFFELTGYKLSVVNIKPVTQEEKLI